MAEIVKGTMAAVVPMAFPTIARVNGISITNKIMNGKERNTFTIKLNTSYTGLLGPPPPPPVQVKIMAGIKPKMTDNSVDQKTIYKV